MTWVLGVDPSLTALGIGLCGTSRPPVVTGETWTPPKGVTGVERLYWFKRQFAARFQGPHGLCLVVIEGYAFSSFGRQHDTAELGGVIRLAAVEAGLPFMVVPPKALKKFLTDDGNAEKPAMVQAVNACVRPDPAITDHNQADAIALAYMGLVKLGVVTWSGSMGQVRALLGPQIERVARIRDRSMRYTAYNGLDAQS